MMRGLLLASLPLALAFVPAPPVAVSSQATPRFHRHIQVASEAAEGLHGTGSRFMSLSQLLGDDIMPRIVQIAGLYPGITANELNAVVSTASPERGRWAYDFSDPDGPQMGTVALPGSELVDLAVDPVVVISPNTALGIEMYGQEVEVLVLIDRADRDFHPRKFFAFSDPSGSVVIRWFDAVPSGYAVLGRVLYVTLPHLPQFGKKKTGWMEMDED